MIRRVDLPAAFLEMIELTISGVELTVAVTSLVAYIVLSAGTIFSVCPTIQQPVFSTASTICCLVNFTLKPSMDSSLSKVPPVRTK